MKNFSELDDDQSTLSPLVQTRHFGLNTGAQCNHSLQIAALLTGFDTETIPKAEKNCFNFFAETDMIFLFQL